MAVSRTLDACVKMPGCAAAKGKSGARYRTRVEGRKIGAANKNTFGIGCQFGALAVKATRWGATCLSAGGKVDVRLQKFQLRC